MESSFSSSARVGPLRVLSTTTLAKRIIFPHFTTSLVLIWWFSMDFHHENLLSPFYRIISILNMFTTKQQDPNFILSLFYRIISTVYVFVYKQTARSEFYFNTPYVLCLTLLAESLHLTSCLSTNGQDVSTWIYSFKHHFTVPMEITSETSSPSTGQDALENRIYVQTAVYRYNTLTRILLILPA